MRWPAPWLVTEMRMPGKLRVAMTGPISTATVTLSGFRWTSSEGTRILIFLFTEEDRPLTSRVLSG